MADFSMTKYWYDYQAGTIRLGQLGEKLQRMREGLFYAEDLDEAQAKLAAAEAEYKKLESEVDDLKCLADTGKHRAELNQEQTVQFKTPYGGFHAHCPGR